MTVVGQILDEMTGRGVEGVRLQMRYVAGVALTTATTSGMSGKDGVFQLSSAAESEGPVSLTIDVASPGQTPYVAAVDVQATSLAGNAAVFHSWVSAHPTPPYAFRITASDGTPLGGVTIEFQRTGGRTLYHDGAAVNVVTGTTDASGIVFPFTGFYTDTTGHIMGDLFVRAPSGVALTVPGVSYYSAARFREHHSVVELTVGN